jgi:hypothetical protein
MSRTTPRHLSRRTFLRAAGAAASALALPPALRGRALAAPPPTPTDPTPDELAFIRRGEARFDLWGRITWMGYPIRAEPGLNKEVVDWLPENTVLPLLETLHAEGGNPNNTLWYRIENGYLYTSGVQAIKPYVTPEIVTEIDSEIDGEPGFWAEVIVPYTIPRNNPNGLQVHDEYFGERVAITHYYSSVHRVLDVVLDDENNAWYQVYDDKPDRPPVYVIGRHMRRLTQADFAPISVTPGAAKEMRVTLAEGRIDCYEGADLVFSTLTSSGGGGFGTPPGDHAVVFKQPSRHMYTDPEDPVSGGSIDEDFFDLPGVPFNTFFTTLGHAIHGTWWHGDFGRPRSHGCLNVTPEAARWLYRWVEPVAAYDEASTGSASDPGTPIIVI